MKLTLSALLTLCLCLSGCGRNEKLGAQAKGQKSFTSVVQDAKEAQSKPRSPEPKIEAKDNSKAKPSGPKQDAELTEEEAFKIVLDALSGIAFDERNKALYKIEVDDNDFDFPSVSFVSRVPPGFPSDKLNAGQDLRRIMFRVESATEAARVKIAEINKRIEKIEDAEKGIAQEILERRNEIIKLSRARNQKTPAPKKLFVPIPVKPAIDQNSTTPLQRSQYAVYLRGRARAAAPEGPLHQDIIDGQLHRRDHPVERGVPSRIFLREGNKVRRVQPAH